MSHDAQRLVNAVELIGNIDLADPFAKKSTVEDIAIRAGLLLDSAPHIDFIWARKWIVATTGTETRVNATNLISAWKMEAAKRVASAVNPRIPAEIEDNPARWQQWEKNRRAAIIRGYSPRKAEERANHIAGVKSAGQIAGGATKSIETQQRELSEILEKIVTERSKHENDAYPQSDVNFDEDKW